MPALEEQLDTLRTGDAVKVWLADSDPYFVEGIVSQDPDSLALFVTDTSNGRAPIVLRDSRGFTPWAVIDLQIRFRLEALLARTRDVVADTANARENLITYLQAIGAKIS